MTLSQGERTTLRSILRAPIRFARNPEVIRGTGEAGTERMKFGMVRYRPTTHKHKTVTGPNGCWTLVLAGPIERAWGFFRDGKWLPWREYEDKYGHGMRCD